MSLYVVPLTVCPPKINSLCITPHQSKSTASIVFTRDFWMRSFLWLWGILPHPCPQAWLSLHSRIVCMEELFITSYNFLNHSRSFLASWTNFWHEDTRYSFCSVIRLGGTNLDQIFLFSRSCSTIFLTVSLLMFRSFTIILRDWQQFSDSLSRLFQHFHQFKRLSDGQA